MGFPGGSDGEESASSMGDLGSAPGSGRAPGEGKGCPPLPMPFTLVSPRAFPKFLLFPALGCVRLLVTSGCSPPGSSVHGVFQARILEWVAISYPRDLPKIEPTFLAPPALAGLFLATVPSGKLLSSKAVLTQIYSVTCEAIAQDVGAIVIWLIAYYIDLKIHLNYFCRFII